MNGGDKLTYIQNAPSTSCISSASGGASDVTHPAPSGRYTLVRSLCTTLLPCTTIYRHCRRLYRQITSLTQHCVSLTHKIHAINLLMFDYMYRSRHRHTTISTVRPREAGSLRKWCVSMCGR